MQESPNHHRYFLFLPVGLGLGALAYYTLPVVETHPAWLVGLLIIVCISWWLCRANAWAYRSGGFLLMLMLGFGGAQWEAWRLQAPVLMREIHEVGVRGRVVSVERLEKGNRLLLEVEAIGRLPADALPERIRIKLLPQHFLALPGDRVFVKATLYPPPRMVMPGAFDFSRHFFFQRIGAVGYAVQPPRQIYSEEKSGGIGQWRRMLLYWKHGLAAQWREAFGAVQGNLLTALALGDRKALPEPVLDGLRRAGLAHMLAISGMHVGMVAGLVFFGVRALLCMVPWLALHFPVKQCAAAVSMLAAAGYVLLVGAPVPAVRALVIAVLLLGGILAGREASPMRSLALAALVILLITPHAVVQAGFQLSFAAAIALVAWYESCRARGDLVKQPVNHVRRYVGGVLVVSALAGLATMPLSLYHFQQAAGWGMLGNLLAMPLLGFVVMPALLLAMILMPVGLSAWSLWLAEWGVGRIVDAAEWVAALPLPGWNWQPSDAGLLLICLGGLWWALWRSDRRWLGPVVIGIGVLLPQVTLQPDLLVSDDGQVIAVREDNGWVLWKGEPGYETEQWEKALGISIAETIKKRRQETASAESVQNSQSIIFHETRSGDRVLPRVSMQSIAIRTERHRSAMTRQRKRRHIQENVPEQINTPSCDPEGCVRQWRGYRVALPNTQAAVPEDCRMADIVLTSLPAASCAATLVIDQQALQRGGAWAVRVDAGALQEIPSYPLSMSRPWWQGE